MVRGKRSPPGYSSSAHPPRPLGILELDRFSKASLTQWRDLSRDLDELQATLFFGLRPEQRCPRSELIAALRARPAVEQKLCRWVRSVTYRYNMEPLSAAGSLVSFKGGLQSWIPGCAMAPKNALIERALGGELSHHLGDSPGAGDKPAEAGNHRNGGTGKAVLTGDGPLRIEAPRNREGSVEPLFIPNHKSRFTGLDDKIVAVTANRTKTPIYPPLRRIPAREIQAVDSHTARLAESGENAVELSDLSGQ